MGRMNYVEELEYDIARGADTTSPVNLLTSGFVRQALNCNLGPTGGYIKRDGTLGQLSSKVTGLAIRSGVEYRNLDGTVVQPILFCTNDTNSAKVVKGDGAGGTTDLVTGLDATKRVAFAQLAEQLYVFNGDSTNTPFVYEGTAARDLGLAAPAGFVDGDLAESTGGSLEESSAYVFAYTYAIRDAITLRIIAESSPSDFGRITLTAGKNRANMDVVGSGVSVPGSLEVIIRIYRTVANGSIMFFQSNETDANATIACDLPDAGLDYIQLALDNSRLVDFEGYSKARFPTIARNRLFVAHETRNEVRFSKIGATGPLLESFPALNFASVEGLYGASDRLVGMSQINGIPIVMKQRSIGRLEEVGLPEIANTEDLVTYVYREISQTVGAVSHFAQCQVYDELVFLGQDNVYATNGQTVRPIASLIQTTIRSCGFSATQSSRISMVNDTKNRRILIQVFSSVSATQPTLTLVGDYQQYPDFRWTFYDAGTDTVTHPGWKVGCFFQQYSASNGSLETFYGNSNKDGQFYKINTGTFDDDNGTERGIAFKVVTRPYTMGHPMVVKLFKNGRIFVEADSDDYALDFYAVFDLSSENEFNQEFTIPSIGNNWDENNWDDGDGVAESGEMVWSGPNLAELTYDPHRKAKFMQLVFEQIEQDAPITLLGWGVSGSIFSGI